MLYNTVQYFTNQIQQDLLNEYDIRSTIQQKHGNMIYSKIMFIFNNILQQYTTLQQRSITPLTANSPSRGTLCFQGAGRRNAVPAAGDVTDSIIRFVTPLTTKLVLMALLMTVMAMTTVMMIIFILFLVMMTTTLVRLVMLLLIPV